MGTKSLSCPQSAEANKASGPPSTRSAAEGDKSVVLTRDHLTLEDAIQQVADPTKGAVVIFFGCVRGEEEGVPIASITYEAYLGMAEKEMTKILQDAQRRWQGNISIHHRIGRVPVEEASLIVASAAAHRKEAFEACEFVVDQIKKNVPIWKTGFEWKIGK